MIKKVLDGDEDIISDEEIWNCFYCYTCHSVCPANINACEVNQILRQMSIEQKQIIGKIAPFLTYGESFLEMGIGSIPNAFFDRLLSDFGEKWLNLKINLDQVRKEMGLGPVVLPEDSIEEIKGILKSTGFITRLEKIRLLE
jgi:heterodisulfide reductase subunit C